VDCCRHLPGVAWRSPLFVIDHRPTQFSARLSHGGPSIEALNPGAVNGHGHLTQSLRPHRLLVVVRLLLMQQHINPNHISPTFPLPTSVPITPTLLAAIGIPAAFILARVIHRTVTNTPCLMLPSETPESHQHEFHHSHSHRKPPVQTKTVSRPPTVSPVTGDPVPAHYLHASSVHFQDTHGRSVLLRGVNLSGGAKNPPSCPSQSQDGFWDNAEGGNVSFVNSTLNLDDGSADVSWRCSRSRLRAVIRCHIDGALTHSDSPRPTSRLGIQCASLRVHMGGPRAQRTVSTCRPRWNAGGTVSVSGDSVTDRYRGIYDHEYMDYVVRCLYKCKDFGFRVYMDPHQDVVSRRVIARDQLTRSGRGSLEVQAHRCGQSTPAAWTHKTSSTPIPPSFTATTRQKRRPTRSQCRTCSGRQTTTAPSTTRSGPSSSPARRLRQSVSLTG
jgi:hypothetical protein